MPRMLHWVFKVADRGQTIKFYRSVLGMRVLRHEEFEEGCDAQCNGPYDGKWSKSMVGYGPEDNHFVVELTYNYGVKHYDLGNDYNCIKVSSTAAFKNAMQFKDEFPVQSLSDAQLKVQAPGGYNFEITNADVAEGMDPVTGLVLNVTSLAKSLEYWNGLLGMSVVEKSDKEASLSYGEDQATLVLHQIAEPLNHASAYGRVAFACPAAELPEKQKKAEEAGHKVLTPLISLDTPGKATVQVVILADPDGYEICFVGDEAFRELSQVDPKADELLDKAMAADGSKEWYAKRQAYLAKLDAQAELKNKQSKHAAE
ncbi:juvenile hormone binding protein [Salpingoeca rosetta]|uniref:Juvenile hormone binding protein n=1 Tax=Salpingoeca rosetta (strain ATCC 50818 / BSB-021) TaxID=946362 RepID=F2TWI4_SALR5|nr:juvenile hormone binding protein [Salpingoeca rosetta]EGD72430.1 juvenile hormone binding protein [Salpingoeca rosetta]|eukprot:XP_004998999.1 juvenile hormone binding protein [Salpingoeca rosetta]